jgi:hypothetical protein
VPKAKPIFTAAWYPWYVDAVLDSERVAMLTLTEEGAYRRAIDRAWKKGSIPSDPEVCAKTIGKKCTPKIAEKVLTLFVPMPGNPERMINAKLEQVRKEQKRLYLQKSKAGKEGMRKRWKEKASGDNDVITLPNKEREKERRDREDSSNEESVHAQKAAPETKPLIRTLKKSNEQYLADLKSNPAYSHVDVEFELAKAKTWAETHGRQVTQKFFTNWINRIDKPIHGANGNGTSNKNGNTPRRTSVDKLREQAELLDHYPSEAELAGDKGKT